MPAVITFTKRNIINVAMTMARLATFGAFMAHFSALFSQFSQLPARSSFSSRGTPA
jgi:hypothetical protein